MEISSYVYYAKVYFLHLLRLSVFGNLLTGYVPGRLTIISTVTSPLLGSCYGESTSFFFVTVSPLLYSVMVSPLLDSAVGS